MKSLTLLRFFVGSIYSCTCFSLGIPAPAAEAEGEALTMPHQMIVDRSLPAAQVEAQVSAARRYGSFWNTGDEAVARAALSLNFQDRTLPPGRAQGVEGPLAASKTVRKAIPDLRCEVEQLIVAADRVVVHLHFRGHFTGVFKGVTGGGQSVDFIATDIYRIEAGRIAENWHLEDNLTFLTQLGLVHLN